VCLYAAIHYKSIGYQASSPIIGYLINPILSIFLTFAMIHPFPPEEKSSSGLLVRNAG